MKVGGMVTPSSARESFERLRSLDMVSDVVLVSEAADGWVRGHGVVLWC
jgi:hypothetical protein